MIAHSELKVRKSIINNKPLPYLKLPFMRKLVFLLAMPSVIQAIDDHPAFLSSDNKLFHYQKSPSISLHTQRLSFHQSIVVGGIAGTLDVVVNHPFWAIRIMMQDKKAINFRPYNLYRGLISNALTMVPLTTSRISISSFLKNSFQSIDEKDSLIKMILCPFMGGALPSFFAGPTELLRNLEYKYKTSFWKIYAQYVQHKGYKNLFRGTPGIAIRDGIYTASFFSITPLIEYYFEYKNHLRKESSMLLGGVMSGIFAAIASHPFDTIKGTQQSHSMERDLSMLETALLFYEDEDKNLSRTLKRVFRGILPRGIRVASGVIVISTSLSTFSDLLFRVNQGS